MRDEFFLSKETRSLATATDIFLESLKPDGLIRNYLHGGVGKTPSARMLCNHGAIKMRGNPVSGM
jgi:hypothetical protein